MNKIRFKAVIILNLFFSCLLSFQLYSQVAHSKDNFTGTVHYIQSEILDEEREVKVYLPKEYAETEKNYPVLYILDGQRFYLYATSLNESFRQYDLTPEFIVVGITNSYPQRFSHFDNGKEKFIGFIEKELTPYIDTHYRTKKEKLIFGWEYAGSLAFHILTTKPSLFDGYFLASPFPIKNRVNELKGASLLKKTLYFAVSPNEYEVNQGTNKLDSLLTKQKTRGLIWTYSELKNEEHRSTPYPTLYHGLRKHFEYYPELQVDNLSQFIDAGGLDYAYSYAKERALRYGFSSDLSLWSRYTIIRSTLRAEDYNHFKDFMEVFNPENNLIQELIDGNRDYAASGIAKFYEKNNRYDKAIEIYRLLIKKSPNSENLLMRTGDAHMAQGNIIEAKKYFKQAQKTQKKK
ncbi:alpha/beta hydrolase-fold protein [Zhouia amylolytica]|uniref:alpha/beta hydrolase-fold protein n=1 Tax=Zhouia amylolytica TaxID=376730 RepID=UPI0020CC849B|nr:alpha/beta hydrolase-fold protein [Zhouia amylolytica]MCQ0111683.1 tetratricopeptide repeat protein [Zhouia amylolytica]